MDRFLPPQPWEELSPWEEDFIAEGGDLAKLEEETWEVACFIEEWALRGVQDSAGGSPPGGAG